ncbi:hypothetical protein [Desulfolucanica intricata]|uniref:hypothetical protein n=1 Tax=Desulfolucanica intricata TaxID=1285191 RepID=UPI0008353DA9|nr:hypothetical protein [Desulfolucanica intricata]
MTVKIKEPYMVNDLVVYFISENEAIVTDYDCRFELKASLDHCECCTFRFNSYRKPGFECRHIKAVKKLLGTLDNL